METQTSDEQRTQQGSNLHEVGSGNHTVSRQHVSVQVNLSTKSNGMYTLGCLALSQALSIFQCYNNLPFFCV